MGYSKYLHSRSQTDETVQSLIVQTNAVTDRDSVAAKNEIMTQFSTLPFSKRVWDIFFLNTFSLSSVKRKDGRPYATHPTRMALLGYLYLDHQKAHELAVPAIMHDYLEETGGISVKSVRELKKIMSHEPLAIKSAILLSEPIIDYQEFGSPLDQPFLKRVAYVLQTRDALQKNPLQELANVSVIDKFDNLHDLGYLFKSNAPEKRKEKLSQRVAFFSLVLQEIGPFADPMFKNLLDQAITSYVSEHQLEHYYQQERARLDELWARHGDRICELTAAYQRELGDI